MFVENITFEFYTLPDNKLYPELYVGMRTNVTVVAIYTVGVYKKATIKLKDRNPGQFFDVTDVSCKHGSSINSSNEYKIQDRRGLGVSIIFFTSNCIWNFILVLQIQSFRLLKNIIVHFASGLNVCKRTYKEQEVTIGEIKSIN